MQSLQNKNILIIEDEINLGESIKKLLEQEGHHTTLVRTLKEARNQHLDQFQLILLDWMLPDGQGIDFLKELRAKFQSIPIIMLTARNELIDKVLGLEAGSNDYMVKPFEPRELLARIRVQLRTIHAEKEDSPRIQQGDLVVEVDKREVHFKGQLIEMTKMEFDLLRLLAENPQRAFSREEILNKVWGYENFPSTRTVDTHVLQLRQKLDDSLIETIRGIGYRFKKQV